MRKIEFVNSEKFRKEVINEEKISKIIRNFNKQINKRFPLGKKSVSLNTTLDMMPLLNKSEFDNLTERAKKNGWEIEMNEDNYNSITYHLKINMKFK